MTADELIELLKENPNCDTDIIVVDNEGREFTIENVTLTMGGSFHSMLELKEIKKPQDKWFRTKEIYLQDLEDKLKIYTSDTYREQWEELCGDTSRLDELIERHKLQIDSIKKHYKPNEK